MGNRLIRYGNNYRKEVIGIHGSILIGQTCVLQKIKVWGGCHSYSHRDMTSLDNKHLCREIRASKEILEKRTGEKIEMFSYPHGKYSNKIKDIVSISGYK